MESNHYMFKGIASFCLFAITLAVVEIASSVIRNEGHGTDFPLRIVLSLISFFGMILTPLAYFYLAYSEEVKCANE